LLLHPVEDPLELKVTLKVSAIGIPVLPYYPKGSCSYPLRAGPGNQAVANISFIALEIQPMQNLICIVEQELRLTAIHLLNVRQLLDLIIGMGIGIGSSAITEIALEKKVSMVDRPGSLCSE